MEFSWFIMRNEYKEYLRSCDHHPPETVGICRGQCGYSFMLLHRMILRWAGIALLVQRLGCGLDGPGI